MLIFGTQLQKEKMRTIHIYIAGPCTANLALKKNCGIGSGPIYGSTSGSGRVSAFPKKIGVGRAFPARFEAHVCTVYHGILWCFGMVLVLALVCIWWQTLIAKPGLAQCKPLRKRSPTPNTSRPKSALKQWKSDFLLRICGMHAGHVELLSYGEQFERFD